MTRALAVAVVILLVIAGSAMSAEANSPDDSYAVQDGDTLLAIASKIGIPNDQLLDWVSSTVVLNGLKDADHLKSGQLLKLPPSSSKTATTGVNGTYIVRDGDTLLGIAAKVGIPVDQQLGWVATTLSVNGLANADQLASGQTLTFPGQPAAPAANAGSSKDSVSAPAPPPPPSISSSGTGPSSVLAGGVLTGTATSYSDSFTNKMMGCSGAGPYNPNDSTLVAVGPALYDQFPCGTATEVCGPKGCINVARKDSCPGCLANNVDLSRAGLSAVCGPSACTIRLRRLP